MHSKKSGIKKIALDIWGQGIFINCGIASCEVLGNWGPANKGPPVIPKILKYKILSTKYRIKGMLAWHLSGNLELMG